MFTLGIISVPSFVKNCYGKVEISLVVGSLGLVSFWQIYLWFLLFGSFPIWNFSLWLNFLEQPSPYDCWLISYMSILEVSLLFPSTTL